MDEKKYKGLGTLGLAVQILVGLAVSLCVAKIAILFLMVGWIVQKVEPPSYFMYVVLAVDLLYAIPYFLAGVLFLVWSRRAFRNLSALNVTNLSNKEWYCIWGFFIPFANFVIPYRLINEIWKASDPAVLDSTAWREGKNSPLVISWGVLFMSFLVLNMLRIWISVTRDLPEALAVLLAPIPSAIHQFMLCGAGVLLILIIRDISTRQASKASLMGIQ